MVGATGALLPLLALLPFFCTLSWVGPDLRSVGGLVLISVWVWLLSGSFNGPFVPSLLPPRVVRCRWGGAPRFGVALMRVIVLAFPRHVRML